MIGEAAHVIKTMDTKDGSSPQSSRALKLRVSADVALAIAVYELAELLEAPQVQTVPFAPPWCAELVDWAGVPIPVFDFSRGSTGVAAAPENRRGSDAPYVLIAAYQAQAGMPLDYIGIRVLGVPLSVAVEDEDFVPLPDSVPTPGLTWPQLAVSCYHDGLDTVPIIDIQRAADLQLTSP